VARGADGVIAVRRSAVAPSGRCGMLASVRTITIDVVSGSGV
jgi:hypothetical protein